MKPKGLSELCAATSHLANQTGIKKRSFDHPQAELDILSFQKTYMGHGNQRPEIELVQAFMPVLVTSIFDDDSIKKEQASMETTFSHYKSMGNFLDTQGQLTP